MTRLTATVKDGRVELSVPADWPDGIEVEIHPLEQGTNGASEALSAEEIASTLKVMDSIEPLDMTDAELSAWEARIEARKAREKAKFKEHLDELSRQWDDSLPSKRLRPVSS